MALPITPSAWPEALPRVLAEQLDAWARDYNRDHDVTRVLTTACHELQALSWARFKARQDKLTRAHLAQRMMARHQARRTGACHA